MKKGQFNFVWLFAIVAGGTILFLAIYGAMQVGDTLRYGADTEAAKSISILTDPLQAGFAEGSFGKIVFRQEARVNNICFDGEFGKNDISVSQRSDIGAAWNIPGSATSVYNKYIFSSEKNSGFEYYVFSKPFDFPYEVSDLIFLTTEDYCFVNAPEDVVDEVVGLNIPNVETEDCEDAGFVNVCFGGGSDCDVIVYGSCLSGCDSVYDEGTVVKGSDDMKYVGALMYGAIFADKEIYDCNVARLLYRAGKIAEVFSEKADLMDARGCNTNLKGDLIVWEGLLAGVGVEDVIFLRTVADDIERKNVRGLCRIW